jgi:protein-tyrosine phosphatase
MGTKVLMVCLGNICRSPLAEGILSNMVNPAKVLVDSAGTGSYHLGNAPDPRSIAVAEKNGIDISQQRCRVLTQKDVEDFDHIYVMDKNNHANVLRLCQSPEQKAKVSLLLAAAGMGNAEVPDPYYGGADGFAKVFALIQGACSSIAQNLNNQ